jgi:hypothetical protein
MTVAIRPIRRTLWFKSRTSAVGPPSASHRSTQRRHSTDCCASETAGAPAPAAAATAPAVGPASAVGPDAEAEFADADAAAAVAAAASAAAAAAAAPVLSISAASCATPPAETTSSAFALWPRTNA